MNFWCAGACVFLAGSISSGAVAFGQPAAAVSPTLQLSGSIELSRLIDLCATRLKISVDYDPALLKQPVTWRTPAGSSDLQVWEATNRLLAQRGLTTVKQIGAESFSVVKIEEAPRLVLSEPQASAASLLAELNDLQPNAEPNQPNQRANAQPAKQRVRAGFRSVTIRLEHVSTRDALETVKPTLRAAAAGGGGGQATIVGPGVVAITDVTPRVDEAIVLLAAFDKPENATVVEEVALRYVGPAQAVTLVQQLITKRDAVAGEKLTGEVLAGATGSTLTVIAPRRVFSQWEALIRQVDRREPVESMTYTPRYFGVKEVAALIQQIAGGGASAGVPADDRFKVIVEEPTGSLLVTATATQHTKISELLQRLDSVPGEARRPVRTFVVRNRPVNELITVLDKMIGSGVLEGSLDDAGKGSGSGGSQTGGVNAGGGLTPAAPSGVSPAALPTGANPTSVIMTTPAATGSPLLPGPGGVSVQQRSGGRGGVPLSMTADEATSTIIAVGDARLMDQLGQLIKKLDVRQPQVMLEVMLVTLSESDSLQLGVQLEKLNLDGSISSRLTTLFGLATAASSGVSGAVLSPGDFSIVARALQTLSTGRTGSFPRVLVANNQRASFNGVTQQPFGSSFTAGNSSSPTTTFGGTLDAGTQISVKPQISEGESLLLEYNVSISSFVGAGSGNLPPARQVNSVQSQATVPDGYAVVVGGLEVKTEGTSATQVPLLGDIPLLGNLFKDQSITSSRTRFFVFIRAGVMRGTTLEELRHVSEAQRQTSQVPSGWPENEPQVIR